MKNVMLAAVMVGFSFVSVADACDKCKSAGVSISTCTETRYVDKTYAVWKPVKVKVRVPVKVTVTKVTPVADCVESPVPVATGLFPYEFHKKTFGIFGKPRKEVHVYGH